MKPAIHPARLPLEEFREQVDEERSRGTGPGGQRRNRVETAVRLVHRPTGVTAKASESRSQDVNRRRALRRLRLRLAVEWRTPLRDDRLVPPGAYEPSPLWLSRLREGRMRVNPRHADLPALLAEALDVLEVHRDDLAKAAAALRIHRSQLLKLLALEPVALSTWNARRKARGLRPLRAR